ncbi:MAG: hypothetical protein HQL87_16545 [Magnetococcales bacterium]|nr:hypothetical protein [Magnetococcales bacterium]
MRPYGIKRKDFGCCPGHDKFPVDPHINPTRDSHRKHAKETKMVHRIARARLKTAIHRFVNGNENVFFDGV